MGGLTDGTRYAFRVAVVNAMGVGPWSDPVTATPAWTPAAPSGLTPAVAPAPGVGSGAVTLTWTAPASDGGADITDYVVERSVDGTTWASVETDESPATSSMVRGLANGTPYWFRVAAQNAVGISPWSDAIQATPVWRPSAATALRAAVVGSRTVRLTWHAPSNGGAAITDYVIQHAIGGKPWTTVRDGVSTTPSRTIARLSNGTSYRFRVAARNNVGLGPWSTVATATPTAR